MSKREFNTSSHVLHLTFYVRLKFTSFVEEKKNNEKIKINL